MIPAILSKALRDRRRAVMGYGLGLAVLATWLGLLFPVMRESDDFVEFMENLPTQLMSAFGMDSSTFLSAAGFLTAYLYTLFAPLLILSFVISAVVAEVMAEERDGLVDMLLSSPVSRTRVFLEKAGGVGLAALALVAVLTGALLVVNPIFDLSLSVTGVLAAGLSLWLLGVVFGAVTLVAGTFTGRSAAAGGVAGSLAFLAWFINSFSDLFPPLQSIDWASPFTWYQEPSPLLQGFGAGHLWLAITAALLMTVATFLFRRRDLATERAVLPEIKALRRSRKRKHRPRAAWLLTGFFRKTIWDRRHSVWGWGGGLGLLTLVMFSAWPALAEDAEALAGLISSLPREVFAMFGMSDPEAIVTAAGFISSRTYQAIGPILIVMFVVRGVSMAMVKGGERRRFRRGALRPILPQNGYCEQGAGSGVLNRSGGRGLYGCGAAGRLRLGDRAGHWKDPRRWGRSGSSRPVLRRADNGDLGNRGFLFPGRSGLRSGGNGHLPAERSRFPQRRPGTRPGDLSLLLVLRRHATARQGL